MTDLEKQVAEALRMAKVAADRMGVAVDRISETLDQFDAQAAEQAAGGGESVPYCHIYEYDSPLGLHRALYPKPWNGYLPNRTVPVYTHPAPAAPSDPQLNCAAALADLQRLRDDPSTGLSINDAGQAAAYRHGWAHAIDAAISALDATPPLAPAESPAAPVQPVGSDAK